MTITSLKASVAPCTGKSITKEERICYTKLHFAFRLKPIVRNCVGELEFTQTKIDFSERGVT